MPEIPEDLLRRSAEAKAKALGVPVEQVLAEMRGEATPPAPETPEESTKYQVPSNETEERVPAAPPEPEAAAEEIDMPEPEAVEEPALATPAPPTEPGPAAEEAREQAAVATVVETAPSLGGNGQTGDGEVRAAVVSPRPVLPPAGLPEGVRTQRLLTVVKARAIQQVKAEPVDKVSTWPHLMLSEFTALLLMTAFLLVLSAILQAPLLDPANVNLTPNPSKAPWYFLGLQELLSYFDPQIAGVMVPTVVGLIGFMMIPYVDRNPSTKPSDRKFAIFLWTLFMAGSATLTMFGVLFRGRGFNWSYPWQDGVFFDDIKDWVTFE